MDFSPKYLRPTPGRYFPVIKMKELITIITVPYVQYVLIFQDYSDFEVIDQLEDEFADPEFYVDQFYRQVSATGYTV